MSTEYKDPIAPDITNNWTKSTGTDGWACIDDAVREPSNPTVPGDYVSSSTANQVEECTLGGPTTPPVRYGDAQVSVYAAGGTKRSITLQVFEGTTSRSATVTVNAGSAAAWYHLPLTSMPTNWANLRIRMTCNSTAGSSATAATVYETYIRYIETATIILGSSLSETNTLYAITPYKIKRVELASSIVETDEIYALKLIKIRSFGTVSETESLYTITPYIFKPPKIVELSSSIAETDSIYALKNNPIRRLLKRLGSAAESTYGEGEYGEGVYGGSSDSETDSVYSITPQSTSGTKIIELASSITETDSLYALKVSPIRRLVNLISETDSLYVLKVNPIRRLVNLISETDELYTITSQTFKPPKVVELSSSIAETDYLYILKSIKTRIFGMVSEIESLYGIGTYGEGLYGGFSDSEIDSIYALKSIKTQILGTVSETESLYSISSQTFKPPKVVELSSSIAETDSLYVLKVNPYRRLVNLISETDAIYTISPRKVKAFGSIVETDSISTITHRKSRIVNTFTETDSVLTISRRKSRAFSTFTETDSIYSLKVSPLRRLVHTITETDSLWAISALGQKKINIGLITETNIVHSVKINPQHRLVNTITESETVHGISPYKSRILGTITEINLVYSVTRFGVHYPSTRPGPDYLTLDPGKINELDFDENHNAFLTLIARTTSPEFTIRTTSPELTVRTTYLIFNVNHLTGVIIDENHTGYLVLSGRETSPGLNAPNKELILDG